MGLFTKKPGGTFFGNLLRVGSSAVTGGVFGSGKNMIPLEPAYAKGIPPDLLKEKSAGFASTIDQIGDALTGTRPFALGDYVTLPDVTLKADKKQSFVGLALVGLAVYLIMKKPSRY
ncbi:MAG: hypothetical protein ABI295_02350 [Xanthomarina sp.]